MDKSRELGRNRGVDMGYLRYDEIYIYIILYIYYIYIYILYIYYNIYINP